jgi:geranylgeranyl reductase family protein
VGQTTGPSCESIHKLRVAIGWLRGGGEVLGADIEVDVLIVGGGPAGAAAAYHLARHGVDVLMVERSAYPRDKACGDGFTPRGVRAIERVGIDPTSDGFERIDGLRVYRGHSPLIHLDWPDLHDFPDYGVIRTRYDFDELLARQASSAGATVWQRAEAVSPLMDHDWVAGAMVRRLDDGEDSTPVEVRSRWTLAADGASSRFASTLGLRRDATRPLGIAARRYFRCERAIGHRMESWLELYSGKDNLPGYGWVFPVEEGLVNVGAGLIDTYPGFRHLSAKGVFDAFLRMLPREWGITEENAVGPVMSASLPMGMNRRPAAAPGLLPIGDAGGMINPFNGEGIAYAMESGELAADLVHGALESGRAGLANSYPAVLHERYGRYYGVGRYFVRAVGHPAVMKFATRYGLPQGWLMRFLLRLMSNLTDGRDGGVQDRIIYALERLAPAA